MALRFPHIRRANLEHPREKQGFGPDRSQSMSHKFVSALVIMALIAVCAPALSQEEETEQNFRLLRDSATAAAELELEEEEAQKWEPEIQSGTIEVSFFLGFLNLKTTVLAHDQIIYKYTDEATFWGDVEIQSETAFSPGLRLGYNLKKWFSLEGVGTISFSEYSTSIENRSRRPNEPGAPVDFTEPALGEFDAEARSLITGSVGINALVYPFNVKGDAQGRFHPFITGGVAKMWYDMNSNYTDGSAGATDLNIGVGFRLLADENISIRLEALYHNHSMEFSPAEYFRELNEGTTQVPLNEYPQDDLGGFTEQRVTSFDSQSVSTFSYSIGVQASF
jgi:hypothetical protein